MFNIEQKTASDVYPHVIEKLVQPKEKIWFFMGKLR